MGYKVQNIYGDIEGMPHQGSIGDFKTLLSHPENLHLGDEVYMCVPRKERELIERTANLCNHVMSKFYFLPTAEEKLNLHPMFIDEIGVLTTYTSPLEDPLNRFVKRFADVVLSIHLPAAYSSVIAVRHVDDKTSEPRTHLLPSATYGHGRKRFLVPEVPFYACQCR